MLGFISSLIAVGAFVIVSDGAPNLKSDQFLVELIIRLPGLRGFPCCIFRLLLQIIIHRHDARRLFATDVPLSCKCEKIV